MRLIIQLNDSADKLRSKFSFLFAFLRKLIVLYIYKFSISITDKFYEFMKNSLHKYLHRQTQTFFVSQKIEVEKSDFARKGIFLFPT